MYKVRLNKTRNKRVLLTQREKKDERSNFASSP